MTARETIIKAMRERGIASLATASNVHFSRLYAFINGAQLEPRSAGRLRVAMPEVEADTWLEVMAPTGVQVES